MDIRQNEVSTRPAGDYDVEGWNKFYAANPHLMRSVGSAGDDNQDNGDGGEGDGGESGDEGEENENDSEENSGDEGGDSPKSVEEALSAIEDLKKRLASAEDEKGKLLKETMKRKDKAKTAEERAKEAAEQAASLKKQIADLFGEDIDLETIGEKVAERKKAEEEALRKSGDFDKLQKRMKSEHQKQIDAITRERDEKFKSLGSELESANSEIRRLLVSNAFAASKFINDELTITPSMAEKLYGENFKVEADDNGKRHVRAVNGNGEPIVDANGDMKPFEAALREIIEAEPDKDRLFRSKAKPGAGSVVENKGDAKLPKKRARGVEAIKSGLSKAGK